jgi:hypothetical protein
MTRDEAKIFWPMIKAYSEGKTIQISVLDGYGKIIEWEDLEEPTFDTSPGYVTATDYRIKPEDKS